MVIVKKKKNIQTIIFESKLSKKVLDNLHVKKILNNYEIIYLENLSIFLKYRALKYLYFCLSSCHNL